MRKNNIKDTKITLPETTRDDKSFSNMSASYEEVRIPKKQRNNSTQR